jgi:hypothetical protein
MCCNYAVLWSGEMWRWKYVSVRVQRNRGIRLTCSDQFSCFFNMWLATWLNYHHSNENFSVAFGFADHCTVLYMRPLSISNSFDLRVLPNFISANLAEQTIGTTWIWIRWGQLNWDSVDALLGKVEEAPSAVAPYHDQDQLLQYHHAHGRYLFVCALPFCLYEHILYPHSKGCFVVLLFLSSRSRSNALTLQYSRKPSPFPFFLSIGTMAAASIYNNQTSAGE